MKLTKSYIMLKGLHFRAYHGVLPQEHVTGNDYTVDLRLECNLEPASASDQVTDTVNYAEVCQLVGEEMARESQLIEHVAGRIAKRLFRQSIKAFIPSTALSTSIFACSFKSGSLNESTYLYPCL